MNGRTVAERPGSSVEAQIVELNAGGAVPRYDRLATEEPMEIRLRAGGKSRTVAITMRTPGHDFELAAGFLFNEGAVGSVEDIARITYCLDGEAEADQQYNIVNVDLRAPELPAFEQLDRHFTTTSACGVCGKASLEALRTRALPIDDPLVVEFETIAALPDRLRAGQRVFEATGGLHAAALFDREGSMVAVREDVGRHNAFDKLAGWSILQRSGVPAGAIVLVSGRSSFEIVQKAVMSRVPIVCSISAPSSLAVDLARAYGVTLIGFLRGAAFNIYAHADRIRVAR